MLIKVSDERHLQISNAREQNLATNNVVCEERFRWWREYSCRDLV